MATLAELRAGNENIEAQMREWKEQRRANGEDPLDWSAFRNHVQQIGAADPGEAAPDEFLANDDSMSEQERAQVAADTVAPAEGRLATSGKVVSEVNSLHADPAVTGGDTATWPSEAGAGSRTSFWPPRDESKEPGA